MENHVLAEGSLQLQLGRAWDAYADSLAQGQAANPLWQNLAQQVRRQVLDRFLLVEFYPGVRQKISEFRGQALEGEAAGLESPHHDADTIASGWIAQAQALQAWPKLVAEAVNLHRQCTRRRQWADL